MENAGTVIWDFGKTDIPWKGGQQCFDLWQEKCNDGLLPGRKDFHPKELLKTLPMVMLVGEAPETHDLIVRLAGTGIVSMMSRDPTNMRVLDMRAGPRLNERFRAAQNKAAPYMALDVPTPFESVRHPTYNVLVLPLASNGTEVDQLLMTLEFPRAPIDWILNRAVNTEGN